MQIGGDHYANKKIQPIEYIMANDLNFCEGNVVKYITRWREKGGVESLRKIKHYVDFLIEEEINGKEEEIYGSAGSRESRKVATTIS
jgi:hypothetical protein